MSAKDLFDGLLISQDQAALDCQGKYPVIFISLKSAKANNFLQAKDKISEIMRDLYENFRYLETTLLLQGKTIIEGLDNHIVYDNIEQNRAAIWTLLVMAGYLKIIASHNVMDNIEYELALPNKEVKYFYKNIIQVWLSGDGSARYS